MENTDNFDFEQLRDEFSLEALLDIEPPVDKTQEEDEQKSSDPMQTPPRRRRGDDDRKAQGWQKNVLLYLHDFVNLVAILVVVSLLFVRVVVVSGTSMTNTLKDGDYLLVLSNTFYKEPKQGDIIVASKDSFDDGAPIVKRVIATEGQTVDIDFEAGIVYVDGAALYEPYTKTATNVQEGMTFPLTVDEGCIFVLGDNRNGSRDSRYPDIGLIHTQEVLGKVFFLFLPGTNGQNGYGQPNEPRDFSRIGVVD